MTNTNTINNNTTKTTTKEETPMNTPCTQDVRDTAKLFRFKAEQILDESQINVEGIEHKSAGMIASRLTHALENRGTLVQYLPEKKGASDYLYSSSFDVRLIAMLGVQLSGLIVHIDAPMDIEVVANTTFAYKRFRNIARANQFIGNTFSDKSDNKDFWVSKVVSGLKLAVDAGLLTQDEDGLVVRSKSYISTCISRKSISHQLSPITLATRRKERVKNKMQPRKDGTSKESREALEFIEGQGQVINTELLDVLNQYIQQCHESNQKLPEVLQASLHVIEGCNELRNLGNVFYTEYFMDLRGRMYQYAHGGPNPQSSDLARALCYHDEENIVHKTDAAYEFFMRELTEEIADGKSELLTEHMLTRVATNPLGAMTHYLSQGLPITKFFTYMTLAKDWLNFETKGYTDCRIGFGPDAKCSGAQLLSILAGCERMGKACGLTLEERGDDPYELSTQEAAKLQRASSNPAFRDAPLLTRSEIKTPFMAIQYGGGANVPATSKKFIQAMDRIGIAPEDRLEYCKDIVKEGIMRALGDRIRALLEGMSKAAAQVQEITGKDFFTYRHVDGNTCSKKGEAAVAMTEFHFKISFGDLQEKAVIFGATPESKGGEQGWKVPSQTMGVLQRSNFSYYFPVHFIQGLDSVCARAITLQVKKRGLKGFSSIHDQFRVCLRDCPQMMEVVADAYEEVFINNNPLKHLEGQLKGAFIETVEPLKDVPQIVTREILDSKNAYYFE